MAELTEEQIEKLQNGEEIVVETTVWHDGHGDGPMYKETIEVPLVKS